jgi:hypothetical protein
VEFRTIASGEVAHAVKINQFAIVVEKDAINPVRFVGIINSIISKQSATLRKNSLSRNVKSCDY